MVELTVELEDEQEKRLEELAAEERRTKQQLARQVIEGYLKAHPENREVSEEEGCEAFARIAGIASGGPPDASVNHDEIYRIDS